MLSYLAVTTPHSSKTSYSQHMYLGTTPDTDLAPTQVAIFLRLPIAIKSLLLGAMGTVYILLIELRCDYQQLSLKMTANFQPSTFSPPSFLSHAPVFACWDQRSDALVTFRTFRTLKSECIFVL